MGVAHAVAELDDAGLVRAVQDGDTEAFDLLFRRHYPTVRRVCARRMADPEEADEVAQAAFVRAYERIHHCTGDRRFGAWVQVIAFRLCADVYRARHRTTPMEDPLGETSALGTNECEDALLRRERAAEVRQALAALPTRQREVIVARDVEGRRPRDIAATLAVSVGTVDSLLMRARRRMVAACQATGTEHGGVSASVSTASVAVTALAHERPLARIADTVASTLTRAMSGVA
ncbi:MAG: RNA polymerase sigma factor, partial [Actinomycetota bacterium]|nr:RNA polymerase sigma factor [Actinomycetota bacterium]